MIAVVVVAASAHENAVGIALLDKAAADTDAVEKALVDRGFKNAVVAHGQKVNIEVEVVERNPAQTGFVPQARRWVVERAYCWSCPIHNRPHPRHRNFRTIRPTSRSWRCSPRPTIRCGRDRSARRWN